MVVDAERDAIMRSRATTSRWREVEVSSSLFGERSKSLGSEAFPRSVSRRSELPDFSHLSSLLASKHSLSIRTTIHFAHSFFFVVAGGCYTSLFTQRICQTIAYHGVLS